MRVNTSGLQLDHEVKARCNHRQDNRVRMSPWREPQFLEIADEFMGRIPKKNNPISEAVK